MRFSQQVKNYDQNLKNTKHKTSIRFWKRSKYIEKDFKEDLDFKLIDFYKEEGYQRCSDTNRYINPK